VPIINSVTGYNGGGDLGPAVVYARLAAPNLEATIVAGMMPLPIVINYVEHRLARRIRVAQDNHSWHHSLGSNRKYCCGSPTQGRRRSRKRLFGAALDRVFFWNFRPFSYAALLANRYAAEGQWADLVIYAVSVFSSFAAGLVLFGMCMLAAIVVAIRLGVTSPVLLVTLVVFTGMTFIMLLRDVMSIAGLWAVRFQREHKELKNLLKNKQVFYDLTQQIFKNMQSPPQTDQPTAEPPQDATFSHPEPPTPPQGSA
jgi:hypothetical protein